MIPHRKPPRIPGVPTSETPSVTPPTEPREDPAPRDDQGTPELRTATGAATEADPVLNSQQGAYLTTAQGVRVHDTDHSLKAGERGPTLLQDHHLREKVMHFDHERIPERVVHARGTGVHGMFKGYGTAANVTRAAFLAEDVETPVFVRFSTVLGSRGSADTVRDTRGFATKFYTSEGVFDLVGNNIPVFFIQDGIKFPDVIHAGKPHPDREIPQAQSAHDSFWDFVSLHTEAQHHTIWNMSDRGIPRSFRMMEGFGVHTFRLVAADGSTSLVKFHWKPQLGVHSLTWEEAQMLAGMDPDYHRRDLFDAIESGAFPQWELGIQVFPDTPDQMFEGIDLLDPTKLVPEELAPVQPIGLMTLNKNTSDFFAETEQVAFHTGHLVPGIDITNDPLLQARNFSYLDTQLTRLGGPNFMQIPINRPHSPVNSLQRDGFHQDAVHRGGAAYVPNSLDGGCPFPATVDKGAYVEVPAPIAESAKVRAAARSFDDHWTQARLFWESMSPVEQDHIVAAYTFELGKCYEQAIKERQLLALANIDRRLCEQVAAGLGLPAPEPTVDVPAQTPSPALSQVTGSWPLAGRLVGVVLAEHADESEVAKVQDAVVAAGALPLLVAAKGGMFKGDLPVQRTFLTGRSVELDGVLLAGSPRAGLDAVRGIAPQAADGATPQQVDPRVVLLLQEAYRHGKPVGGWGDAQQAVAAAGIQSDAPGVTLGESPSDVTEAVLGQLAEHRVWDRFSPPDV